MRTSLLRASLCSITLLWATSGFAQLKVDYAAPATWLCLPGRADICATPLTSTVVSPETGALSQRSYSPDPTAAIDCFYVYPTVSREASPNADMAAGEEEQHVALEQFARFGARCRTFAPLYRQATLAALTGAASGANRELAYEDVRQAWRYYLAHYNEGRGIVLVGHSQGSFLLERLIAQEIDGRKIQAQLVSAILPGGDIQVPVGRDMGGTFPHIPLCRRADQTGCVIGYSSYLATHPPGADSRFGAADSPGMADACVSPGTLRGADSLDAELPTVGDVAKVLGTNFVENPGLLSASCVTSDSRTYLAVTVKPAGFGAERLGRALTALDARLPGWGLHALDVNLALGDLVEIVARQSQAWTARQTRTLRRTNPP